jgi:serine/threonine-protein kinase
MEASHCPHDGTKLVRFKATADTMLGKVLDGRYKIKKAIGEGGMGTVYSATQMSVDREVAIKVVHPSISTEREAAKRFLREARLASRLNAPNIVNVYDFGQSDENILYLVMEMVKGATLGGLLVAMGSIPPSRVVGMALQLCDALEAAHQLGIVHRDLKPGNIIIAEEMHGRDLVKVLDFGLAKSNSAEGSLAGITNTHSLLGTPLYMAPEMIEGSPVDARTDLYALGCIMHELLTGTPPFNDTAISALFAKHLQEPPPPLPPNVPRDLAQIIYRLMAKRPDDRVPDAQTLRDALFTVAVDTPPTGTPILRSHHGQIMSPMYQRAATPPPAPTTNPAATPLRNEQSVSGQPFPVSEVSSVVGTPSPDVAARPFTPDPALARPYIAALPSSPTIMPGEMMSPLAGMDSSPHHAPRTSAPQLPQGQHQMPQGQQGQHPLHQHARMPSPALMPPTPSPVVARIPVTQRPRPQAPPSNKKIGWIIGGGAIVIGVIIGVVLAMHDSPPAPTPMPSDVKTSPSTTTPSDVKTSPSTTTPSTTTPSTTTPSTTTPSTTTPSTTTSPTNSATTNSATAAVTTTSAGTTTTPPAITKSLTPPATGPGTTKTTTSPAISTSTTKSATPPATGPGTTKTTTSPAISTSTSKTTTPTTATTKTTPTTSTTKTTPTTSQVKTTTAPTTAATKTTPTTSTTKTTPTTSQVKTATAPTTSQKTSATPPTGPTTAPAGKPVVKKPPKATGGDLPFLTPTPTPTKK